MATLFAKYKIIIIGVLSIVLIIGAYYFWPSGQSTDSSLVYSTNSSLGTDVGVGQSILVTLERLRRINIDSNFFQSPVFRSLVDFSRATTSEEIGRPDPFVPIETKKTEILPVIPKKK